MGAMMPVNAPEFPPEFKWINSESSLSLEHFKGHPILLHFWTFCSVNCLEVLAELKKLEDEFSKKGLVVIGVQNAKFFHEQDYNNVKEACHRLNINHPVIVDEDMQISKKFAIRSWPTFVIIDCEGKIFNSTTGENKYEFLKEQISSLILNKNLPQVQLSNWGTIDDKFNFRYPTKAVATEINSNVFYFISDTFNNRIVQLNHEGKFVTSFGEGILSSPLGCCIWKEELIVCDSGHHRVIAFDLEGKPQRKYRVLAGKGEKGLFEARSEYDAKLAPLNCPADVCVWGNHLAISCSGSNQIVQYIVKDDSVSHIAGSGREDLLDGPASFAALAEPSGVSAVSDTVLAFTDSETSSIRLIIKNWNETGKTMIVSLVGGGLFDFGFSDGLGAEAKMQHPLSCAWSPKSQNLYILDSYNNAMRIYSVGKDYLGTVPLSESLNEPSGITWFNGNLIITDTNSHRILIIHENEISQKEDIDSLNVTLVKQIFEGPFARIADYPKNNLNVNLV
jgi:thiol-disulfide isomerase/thioredoxin